MWSQLLLCHMRTELIGWNSLCICIISQKSEQGSCLLYLRPNSTSRSFCRRKWFGRSVKSFSVLFLKVKCRHGRKYSLSWEPMKIFYSQEMSHKFTWLCFVACEWKFSVRQFLHFWKEFYIKLFTEIENEKYSSKVAYIFCLHVLLCCSWKRVSTIHNITWEVYCNTLKFHCDFICLTILMLWPFQWKMYVHLYVLKYLNIRSHWEGGRGIHLQRFWAEDQ